MATPCPVSKSDFLDKAQPIEFVINGVTLTANPKEFSTGSFGWYVNGKASLPVGDKKVTVQIGANLTVVGSKEAAR